MDSKNESQYIPGSGALRRRLAHAYVPFQQYTENYTPKEALEKGTLYPELWMPYRPGRRGYY